jgi:hypothetical protein
LKRFFVIFLLAAMPLGRKQGGETHGQPTNFRKAHIPVFFSGSNTRIILDLEFTQRGLTQVSVQPPAEVLKLLDPQFDQQV